MEETKRRIVFRNANQIREFHLRSRDPKHPEQHFIFGPGATVEAMDDEEELQLATMSFDIVDVAKETPALANTLTALQDQLIAERTRNAELVKAADAMKAELEKSNKRLDARPVKK